MPSLELYATTLALIRVQVDLKALSFVETRRTDLMVLVEPCAMTWSSTSAAMINYTSFTTQNHLADLKELLDQLVLSRESTEPLEQLLSVLLLKEYAMMLVWDQLATILKAIPAQVEVVDPFCADFKSMGQMVLVERSATTITIIFVVITIFTTSTTPLLLVIQTKSDHQLALLLVVLSQRLYLL